MGITGKYDLKGIQKAGVLGIKAALVSTVWGAKLIASPLFRIVEWAINWGINWLANKGIVVVNIGVYMVDGKFDQKGFDKAMDEGLSKVKLNPNITEKEGRALDERVKDSVRKFFKYNR